MNRGGRHTLHAWLLAVALVLLIGGAVLIYRVLPLAGVSVALVSGLAVAGAHLGLLAVVLGPLYARLRRRSRP